MSLSEVSEGDSQRCRCNVAEQSLRQTERHQSMKAPESVKGPIAVKATSAQ